MSKLVILALVSTFVGFSASADVLPPKAANKICRAQALKAAHFIAGSEKPFIVTYVASDVAEISTAITYDFTYRSAINAGTDEALFTVNAYAYPDGTCTIGTISNNIAGND